MPERTFIGVAWPYANGPLHLGHVAGCYLPADIFARYHRLKGNQVLMVSGSDSHGTPITLRAEAEGLPPAQVVAKYHASFLDSWKRLGISFDLFTTTMTDNHRETVHALFRRLHDGGRIYPASMKVAYSPDFQRYLPDRYVEGICPHCGFPNARGDQCDSCGRTLDPVELINPSYRLAGKTYPIEVRDAQHLFFKLSAFQQRLLEWAERQEHWRPNVRNFTRSYLQEGLRDRAISRDLEWGVTVPMAGFEEKRIYVWFEAVVGYLSASKEWAAGTDDPEAWRLFWEGKGTRAYYFLGKDNIPFHTIIWPAMLMAYGGLDLPYDVPANEYLTLEGQKLSTSRNWAVWLPDYLDQFPPDPLRYALAANMPETGDTDFSWAEYVRRNNDELVATYGNLAHRVLTIIQRNFDGRVPEPGELEPADQEMVNRTNAALASVGASLERCRFREALQGFMALAREANRYVDAQAPWRQLREDRRRAAKSLHIALHVITGLKVMSVPFLPFSAQRLHQLLGLPGMAEASGWAVASPTPGTLLPAPQPLFTKLDDSVAEEQSAKLGRPAVG
jgi:methionyl-tRNA synthetase